MQFSSLEQEVHHYRALVRLTQLADAVLEDCLERQLGLAAAIDTFLAAAVRLLSAKAGFVQVLGSTGTVLERSVGRLRLNIDDAAAKSGIRPLGNNRILFVKPLKLGRTRIGTFGIRLSARLQDGGEQVMAFVDALGEQLDTALLGFLTTSDKGPLERLDSLHQESAFQPRARIGHYELLTQLGAGGMGQVLVARAAGPGGLHRVLALKRILPQYCKDPVMVGQFLDEARIGLRLAHPNLVTLYDCGEAAGSYYIAMELVRGVGLDGVLHSPAAPLPPRIASAVVLQALAGLHAAHELRGEDGSHLGLVHRDLSPHNLMIGFDGRVKLLDFGIAKARSQKNITLPGLVKGKPLYMSPEQAAAERLDRRSDLFSVGLILYEAVTGVRPFARDTDVASMNAIVRDPLPAHPAIPQPLWEVIVRATEKQAEDRWRDASALAYALAKAVPPASDAELGRMVSVHFPERLRQFSEWDRTAAEDENAAPSGSSESEAVALQPTQLRPAVGGK